MLCEKCGQNPASVHMQQIINGEKSETHLCQSCAASMEMPLSFDHLLQGFLESFIVPQLQSKQSSPDVAKCPTCGLTYEEFKKSGRVGCTDCYQAFRAELDLLLKNLQGSNKHYGKFPKTSGAELVAKRRMESLKTALAKAIENEEYEEAARLRDEIKGEVGKNA